MKLVRFGPAGSERPGAVDRDGNIRDLSGIGGDWSGERLKPEFLCRMGAMDLSRFPVVDPAVRLGPCAAGVGKIVCIGLNYANHAAETGAQAPSEPVIFMKAATAVAGPNDVLSLPRRSLKLDWEVELGVVIGRRTKYVSIDQAEAHIAGYCVCNDYSERAWQLEGTGTWDKGKCHDGFAPIGPWLVTTDEITDPQTLDLSLKLNGQPMQHGSTRTMIFGVFELVSYVSLFMTLNPGDVLSTGTPPGVGMSRKPPRFLQAGDIVELGIEGLGRQRQLIGAPI